jgi:C1A family cysteine protease
MPFDRHARIRNTVRLADGTSAVTGRFRASGERATDRFFVADLAAARPKRVDLRDELAHAQDQHALDSCTANALAAAHELVERRAARLARPLSRLFIYWNARAIERDVHEDDGITIRDGVHAMRRHGACTEDAWPYLEARVLERPNERAYEEARRHRLDDADRVHIELDAMRACIATRQPVVFGIQLFESFGDGGDHGRIRMPRPDHEKHIGGHTMLAAGYDDREAVFIVRNSWGTGWGERGYCFLPYEYVADRRFTDEAWVLRSERRGPMTDS